MQVQLTVANEKNCGQVIPVNASSFVIGRAIGCNLRSHSTKVSRYHCTILIEDQTIMVQDLGGGNGTFVNGNRVSSVQMLEDGDKLTVGTHLFLVSIQAGEAMPASDQNEFFELASTPTTMPAQSDTDVTHAMNPNKTMESVPSKQPEQKNEVMFEIRLEGQRVSVTKNRLFDLAKKGSVLPDDLVTVAGTKVFADSIQGIVFGDQSPAHTSPPLSTAPPATSKHSATPTTSQQTDPFGFYDFGDIANEVNTVDNVPTIRVARKESAFSALWKALDISFSRVYTMEGNDLVIHSIKALYYVVVVACLLLICFGFLEFAFKWYEDGDLLAALREKFVLLSVSVFGCTMIIVVVRVLLEMLLLAWVESAIQEDREKKE